MNKGRENQTTIFALASGRGRAGVAVVRLSGPLAGKTLKTLIGKGFPEPKKASFVDLKSPESEEIIDKCIILWFPGPDSFTGEDVVELQIHGSTAIIDKLSEVLSNLGLRPAEPGEFTRRAFENSKLDLTQAEGLHDLPSARPKWHTVSYARLPHYPSPDTCQLMPIWNSKSVRKPYRNFNQPSQSRAR